MAEQGRIAALAKVIIRKSETPRTMAVGVPVIVEIENLSPSDPIREYTVTISIPTYCHVSAKTRYESWVRPGAQGIQGFRRTQNDYAGTHIPVNGKLEILEFGICLDRKERSRMFASGESDISQDRLLVDAVVEGERLTRELPLHQIFSLTEE